MCDNIKVAIRVRPLIQREITKGDKPRWLVDNNTIFHIDEEGQKTSEHYSFDHIFDGNINNTYIYETIGKPLVETALKGINSTIFAYGQTSSGKTYTMTGSKAEIGFVPLAVKNMFDMINKITTRKFLIRTSYIEIYNEKINDLLNKDAKDIKLREDFTGNILVPVTETISTTIEEVLSMMAKGEKNRQIGETNMNERSSRSHTIFRIIIESSEIREGDQDVPVQVSQLNFVDLAGSERISQTKASGVRLKEGSHINKSLSTLGLVIRQLSEGAEFVNFRDSKLTRMLQQSLGGNAKTLVVAAITPVSVEHGQSTLAFAQRAKTIKNKPEVNEILTDSALMKRYELKVLFLKKELNQQYSVNKNLETDQAKKDRIITELTERIHMLEKNFIVGKKRPPISKRRHTIGQPIGLRLKPITEGSHILETELPFLSETPMDQFEIDLIEAEKEKQLECINESDEEKPSSEPRKCFSSIVPSRVIPLTKYIQEHQAKPILQASTNKILDVTPNGKDCLRDSENNKENVSMNFKIAKTPDAVLRLRVQELERELQDLQHFTRIEQQISDEETIEGLREQVRDFMKKNADLQQDLNEIRKNNNDMKKTLENERLETDNIKSKFQDEIDALKKQLSESTTKIENIEEKHNVVLKSLQQDITDKDFVYEQMENKYKRRINELLASVENQTTISKHIPVNESVIIEPNVNSVFLQEYLERIKLLEENLETLQTKETKYKEEIEELNKKLSDSTKKPDLQSNYAENDCNLQSIRQGLKTLQSLLTSTDSRQKLDESLRSYQFESSEGSSLFEEIILHPYKEMRSTLDERNSDYMALEEKYNNLVLDVKGLQVELKRSKEENERLVSEIDEFSEKSLKLELDDINCKGNTNLNKLQEIEIYYEEKQAEVIILNKKIEDLSEELDAEKQRTEDLTALNGNLNKKVDGLLAESLKKQDEPLIEELRNELNRKTQVEEELNNLILEETKKISQMEESIKELQSKVTTKNEIIDELNINLEKLQSQVDGIPQLEKTIQSKSEQIIRLNDEIEEKETEVIILNKKMKDLSEELDAVKERTEDLTVQNGNLNKKLDGLLLELASLKEEDEPLIEELDKLRNELNRKTTVEEELNVLILEETKKNTQMEESIKELQSKVTTKNEIIDELNINLEKLQKQVDGIPQLEKTIQLKSEQIIRLNDEIEEKQAEVIILNKKMKHLSEELDADKQRTKDLTVLNGNLNEKLDGLMVELASLKEQDEPLIEELHKLRNELNRKTIVEEELNVLIFEETKKISQMEESIKELQSKVTLKNEIIDELNINLEKLQKQVDGIPQLEKTIQSKSEQMIRLNDEIEEITRKYEQLEENHNETIARYEEATAKKNQIIADLENKIMSLDKDLEQEADLRLKLECEIVEDDLKCKMAQMEKVVDSCHEEIVTLTKQLEDLKNKNEELEETKTRIVNNNNTVITDLHKKIEELEKEILKITEEKTDLENQIDVEKKNLESELRNRILEANEESNNLKNEVETMQRKLDSLQELESLNKAKTEQILKLNDEIEKMTKKNEELDEKYLETSNKYEEKISDLREEIKCLIDESYRNEDIVCNLRGELNNLYKELQKAREEKKTVETELRNGLLIHEDYKRKLEKQPELILKLQKEVDDLKVTLNEKTRSIESLNEELKSLEETRALLKNNCTLQLVTCSNNMKTNNQLRCLKCGRTFSFDNTEYCKTQLEECVTSILQKLCKSIGGSTGIPKLSLSNTLESANGFNMQSAFLREFELELKNLKTFLQDLPDFDVKDSEMGLADIFCNTKKESLILNFQNEFKALKTYIERKRNSYKKLEAEFNELKEGQVDVEELKLNEQKLQEAIKQLKLKVTSEQNQISSLRKELDKKSNDLENQSSNIASMVIAKKKLTDENSKYKMKLQGLENELFKLKTEGCHNCGNFNDKWEHNENDPGSGVLGPHNRPSDVSERSKRIYQENKDLKERIRDLEREWKGSCPINRKERRQSIQNANRSLPETCPNCDLLRNEKTNFETELREAQKRNNDLLNTIVNLKETLKSANERVPDTLEYYKSLSISQEKKIRDLKRIRSSTCNLCLNRKTQECQDQAVQVTPICLGQSQYLANRDSDKEKKIIQKKYDQLKVIAKLRLIEIEKLKNLLDNIKK